MCGYIGAADVYCRYIGEKMEAGRKENVGDDCWEIRKECPCFISQQHTVEASRQKSWVLWVETGTSVST